MTLFLRRAVHQRGLALVLPATFLFLLTLTPNGWTQNKPADMANMPIKSGEHISIIGNTLADRMQHDGWLQTYFYSRFLDQKLVFRNLGFAGDELTVRLRSRNFGSPDEWLSKTKTDTVFAFFGYNESFAGKDGLQKFKQDLENFIKNSRSKNYNGKSAARIVLFSPIAHEDLKDPNLPDGKANNKRLAMYTKAMADVAKANGVQFVDLFNATKRIYENSRVPLTINGVHMNERGNEELAKAIDKALFPKGPQPERTTEKMEKIRRAVMDKNFYWFNRYRTVDGYSIYGGRAGLRFVGGQTNLVVMQREMEILDVMTANRDKRVWSVAQGGDMKVDDSNTPPFIPVQTNKPGKGPGGKHLFLDGEEAIKLMTLGKNMKIQLFASEKEFPELASPVQMAFDTKGRLWVAAWPTYPHWKPKEEMNDKLLIFEDTNGDGKADKMKVFADNLHCPTGFEFWNGGVLVASAPDVLFLKDTDGDDKADVRKRVINGIDSADTHHTANSFILDPGGALYFQEGTFHHTQVESPWGPATRAANAGVFRYEPRAQKFDLYVNFGFANPHGHIFTKWGQDIVVDGTGAVPYHGTLFSGQTADFRQRHRKPPLVYKRKTRPCPGLEILSSGHFPDDMQDNLLVPNVIGFLGIMQYKLVDDGASLKGIEVEPILSSKDPNFRPVDVEMGPDGAIWFVDWQNPIIGHMQHNLRDPSRDRKHGRIYRITYENRPLLEYTKVHGEAVEKLLDLLKEPEDRLRYRTRIELGSRDTNKVIPALKKWIRSLKTTDKNYEHQMLEALWLYQNHNVVNQSLLKRMLRSPNFNARAAATKVLCYWRDRVYKPLDLLRVQINDKHPRVRLEAIRALSFFHDEAALAVAVEMLAHPDDQYLRYLFNETLNTLERRLGSKVNRKNIASTLLTMLDKGSIDAKQQPILLQTVCRHGTAKELNTVWNQVQTPNRYNPALRRRVLGWLAEATETRQVKPKVNGNAIRQMLKKSTTDGKLLAAAIRLATAWNISESADELRMIAANGKVDRAARFAAIDGLALLGGGDNQKALASLTESTQALPIRFRAAVALTALDLDAAAKAAAAALASVKEGDDVSSVVEGFLVRKNGSDKLAAALEKQKISADTAKLVLRSMYLAGKNDAALGNVVSKIAGLDASPKAPTAAEIIKLTTLADAKGDIARGERVFRRGDLGCMKCHAINKAGGNIGPDLGPIGGSSPPDYIIRSILDPSQSIKEEYLTKVILTKRAQIFTGVVVERNNNQVKLKDATGKIVTVPVADIDEELKGKSLMPEGVTRILTKNELYDLIRFVTELGKPGELEIRRAAEIRRWKLLRQVPASLHEGIPNREQVRDQLLRAEPDAWEPVYTKVNGMLPIAEMTKQDDGKVVYLQGELQVARSGPVEVRLESNAPAMFWIDEEPFEKQAKASIRLSPGRHFITVRVAAGNVPAPEIRVELHKPADSSANFEVVHGGE